MGTLSKETLQRILILYLVGKFPNGVFSSFRFQKVLYFAEKDAPIRPFTFKRTDHGQYSHDARAVLDELASMKYIDQDGLLGKHDGAKWALASKSIGDYAEILDAVSKPLRGHIDSAIVGYGYLPQEALDKTAHSDPILSMVALYDVILSDNVPDVLSVSLSQEECENWELALNPNFVKVMGRLVGALESTEMDLEDIETIDTL